LKSPANEKQRERIMKKTILTVLAALATIFQLPVFAGEPAMTFREIPIEHFTGNSKFEHRIIPYRFFDTMTIIVEDPDACGQKPINPGFVIENGKLLITYDLTQSTKGASACMLISQFEITGLPHEPLEVGFAGGDEPLTMVKLKRCDFYKPVSDDIYECLAPVIDPNKPQIKD
jgi:hypothetical protein